jgi:RNA polymerase sigma-70 factor, ECF subfamily
VLDPDVVLRDDSSQLPPGAASIMRGARDVGAYALNFSRSAQFVEPALVDGAVGLAIVPQGRLFGALGFAFAGDKITEIDMISDPERLRRVDLAALGG